MESLFPFLASLTAIILVCYLFLKSRNMITNNKAPPQPGGAWPIVGHLPLLAGKQPPHIILGNLAEKYGPIFAIKFGVHPTLIVSSSKIAKRCLTTNDRAFASRPKALAGEILGYDYRVVGFSQYGDYWRNMRKIVVVELLSVHQIHLLKVVEAEVKEAIQELHKKWTKSRSPNSNELMVEMKRWFGDLTMNVILKIIVGKRYVEYGENGNEGKENDVLRETLRKYMELSGKFVVSDAVPWLKWLDLGGVQKEMKKTIKIFDSILDEWLVERKMSGLSKGEDFMDLLFSILGDAKELSGQNVDTINKAICLTLILGAADTTSIACTWALSLLLNNRDALRIVQQELDTVVGRDRPLTEFDVNDLVYLQAVVKETLRLYPPVPLLIPHEAMEECTLEGYHIPVGTRLFINAAKIQRDPNAWLNPEEFRPERFLTTHKDVDVKGQHYELLPFGSGRRICPGWQFGLRAVCLILATFLHSFDVETVLGPVDMSESVGITNIKATPLEVVIAPRLRPDLY